MPPTGRFRACPPGFLYIDTFALPRLGGARRYLFVAIDRATRLMTMQVAPARTMAHAGAFLTHCQRFYPFRLYRVLTDNGQKFTLRGYRGRNGARTTNVHPFTQRCRRGQIRHSLTKAYHPWTNGLVERTGDTIKAETIYRGTSTRRRCWTRRSMDSNAIQRASALQSHGRQNARPVDARMVSPRAQTISPAAVGALTIW
ncbi:MAG TPA: DDE-type integrase/transposase/recombinase [Nitrospiraceae bacterium]|nr:DDE-type integrase/transposase/recombinase [Nitrospiraceae bacterium]